MKKILATIVVLIIAVSALTALFTPQGKAAAADILYYYPCAKPVTYHIGNLDDRFGVKSNTFLADLKQAGNVWNSAYGKALLVYDPQGTVSVNMIYDQRQSLDTEIGTLNQSVTQDKSSLQPQIDQYKKLSQDFETKLNSLNEQIDYWNNRGGAPPNEYAKLTQEQQALQTEADQLNAMGQSLNESTDQYNGKISELNQTINNFNQTLAQKPEEGVFDPKTEEIDVYFNNSQKELIHTLAHEMGHALGLGHNSGQSSIMYPHTTETTTASLQDIEALQKLCQRQSRWTIFIERLQMTMKNISSTLTNFTI